MLTSEVKVKNIFQSKLSNPSKLKRNDQNLSSSVGLEMSFSRTSGLLGGRAGLVAFAL
jgi:hypothetical protein